MSPFTPWEEALHEVLNRFAARLDAMAGEMRLDGAERDALIQEVRLRLWRAAPEVETLRAIGPSFVYKAARWAALDLLRDRRGPTGRRAPIELAENLPAPDRAEGRLDAALTGETLERAVATLARDRGVVVSLWMAGHHRTEIASLLGWGEHRVKNLLYRGVEDLRRVLGRGEDPRTGEDASAPADAPANPSSRAPVDAPVPGGLSPLEERP